MKVHEAITAVMGDVRAVGKDSVNQQQRFNFRGIDATVNALSPAMRKHGITVRPSRIIDRAYEVFHSKSGAQGVACRMIVEFTFTGPEGDEIKSVVAAEANDYGDKATPKCMSVAFRTCLLQTFALPTQETDPDAETFDRASVATSIANADPGQRFMAMMTSATTDEAKAKVIEAAHSAGAPPEFIRQLEAAR